jgi:hypothetical protein
MKISRREAAGVEILAYSGKEELTQIAKSGTMGKNRRIGM